MRLIVFTAAAMISLSACTSPDSAGNIVIPARSAALNNLWAPSGMAVPTGGWRVGVCNETDISECGGSFDRAAIQKAAKDGKLSFRYPDGTVRPYKR